MRLSSVLRSGIVDKTFFKMDTLSFLGPEAPGFGLKGSQIKVLTEPSEFFHELCSGASNASKRIVVAALYLGTGDKADTFVKAMEKSLGQNKGQMKVNVLLDYCRGNRNVNGKSSCSMLQHLVNDYEDSCRVSLFHTPDLRGIWKRIMPERYNETIGLQHCKIYVFDDTVLISGANLSTDYFTNRQDRYVVIRDCVHLADFCQELVQKISEMSFQLQKGGNFALDPHWTGTHPFEGDYKKFTPVANDKLNAFLASYKVKHRLNFDHSGSRFDSNADHDTWIFPSLQMGPIGIDHDCRLTRRFLQSGASGAIFKFATGYFNLTKEYQNVMLDESKSTYDIIMAHPEANGFYKAPGPAGGIPPAYTLISQKFYELIAQKGDMDRLKLFEYVRNGWTFHAKGLWYYLPKSRLPVATMIGSPNFGYRSQKRDLEAQFTIVTKNDDLRTQLDHEQQRLFDCSNQVTKETFQMPERQIPLWVRCVVGVARHLF